MSFEDERWPRASAWLARVASTPPRLGVVGLPFNRSVTPGRYDLGPALIRKALERYSTFDFESGRDVSDLDVRDFADCDVHDDDLPRTVDALYSAFRPPVTCILGGDNGATRAGVLALSRFKNLSLEQIGLITLDAHLDLRDLTHGPMNGNPIRALLEDGLPGVNIHQIGLQSFANSASYAADARRYGIHQTPAGTQFVECVSQALEDLASRSAVIYVDIDLDVMDLSYVPACPGARPGGIDPARLRQAARLCGTHPKVTCVDIVELDGDRDVNQQTALAAAAVLLEFAVRGAFAIVKTLLIRNIGQLVTLEGPAGIRLGRAMRDIGLRTGVDLLIAGGKIVEILEAGSAHGADETLDAQGGVVLPGFVDAHTHACFAGSRIDEWQMRAAGATYEQIAASGGGILNTVTATRAASEQFLSDVTQRHLRWMLRNGTTCAEVKSGYGLDFETERKMFAAIARAGKALGMKLRRTYLGAHAIPAGGSESDHLTDCLLAADSLKQDADFVDMFVEEGYFSHASCRRYAATKSFGLPMRLHVDQLCNSGGAALAAEVRALTADHLEHTDENGIRALAEAGVLAGLLPGSVFGLRKSRYADGRRMIDAGVGVYLATDFNPGSSPVASLPFCMRLAVDHMGMTIEEALVASTINPAVSLGLDAELGSLEIGKRADLCIFPVSDYREVVYFVGITPVKVFISGKAVAL